MRCSNLSLVTVLAAGMVSAAAASSNDRLQAVAKDIVHQFDGRWKSHFETFQTAYTDRSSRDVQIFNRCHLQGHVAVCIQSVDDAPALTIRYEPRTVNEVVVTSSDTKGHSTTSIMEIRGDDWTFPWTKTNHDGRIDYRIINHFNAAGSISWQEEARKAGGSWQSVGKGSELRAKQ